jgi:hypothetical protein
MIVPYVALKVNFDNNGKPVPNLDAQIYLYSTYIFNGTSDQYGNVYAYVVKDHIQPSTYQYYLKAGLKSTQFALLDTVIAIPPNVDRLDVKYPVQLKTQKFRI